MSVQGLSTCYPKGGGVVSNVLVLTASRSASLLVGRPLFLALSLCRRLPLLPTSLSRTSRLVLFTWIFHDPTSKNRCRLFRIRIVQLLLTRLAVRCRLGLVDLSISVFPRNPPRQQNRRSCMPCFVSVSAHCSPIRSRPRRADPKLPRKKTERVILVNQSSISCWHDFSSKRQNKWWVSFCTKSHQHHNDSQSLWRGEDEPKNLFWPTFHSLPVHRHRLYTDYGRETFAIKLHYTYSALPTILIKMLLAWGLFWSDIR